jgi:hypothetical protein
MKWLIHISDDLHLRRIHLHPQAQMRPIDIAHNWQRADPNERPPERSNAEIRKMNEIVPRRTRRDPKCQRRRQRRRQRSRRRLVTGSDLSRFIDNPRRNPTATCWRRLRDGLGYCADRDLPLWLCNRSNYSQAVNNNLLYRNPSAGAWDRRLLVFEKHWLGCSAHRDLRRRTCNRCWRIPL